MIFRQMWFSIVHNIKWNFLGNNRFALSAFLLQCVNVVLIIDFFCLYAIPDRTFAQLAKKTSKRKRNWRKTTTIPTCSNRHLFITSAWMSSHVRRPTPNISASVSLIKVDARKLWQRHQAAAMDSEEVEADSVRSLNCYQWLKSAKN